MGSMLAQLCGGAGPAAAAAVHEPRYLNINLVFEVWKDVKFKVLQVTHPRPEIHIPRLLFIWGGLNLPCALLLRLISLWLFPAAGAL